MSIWLVVFIASSSLFIINYFIYPAIVIIMAGFKEDVDVDVEYEQYSKSVSFIVAAYNEEKVIRNKIENCLKLDYPKELLEIIIISDGSDDRTSDIVKEFESDGVISLHEDQRKGKSNALNRAVKYSSNEIIVFSDANNDFSVDAIKYLVSSFDDSQVGSVTGSKKIYTSSDRQSSQGDGLYWKYESKIKYAESKLGSITAADGEILAVRRKLFEPIDPKLINDDAAITFNVLKKGYRVIYNLNAVAYEEASIDIIDDFHVKVRMTTGGVQTLFTEANFLFNPFKAYSWSFFMHKTLRWFAPYFMILIFISNLLLLEYNLMILIMTAQIIFYILAAIGWLKRASESLSSILYVPMYFVSMNTALFIGTLKYFIGNKSVIWKKADR
ncbi:MAG: hypothetical protein DIZ80_06445 [endosymbiont of Galathealinum brachiosum]|uniref:Glycosyltransferase 2-like domain-containing protein n=1 Tax=endosymbiont of Galathealinum brachiosum TaxID=2200906 RepID=A0A370DG12_9GAMM|nr:MAG: hypothetical protein DIZ80_06445 [endosymbiont of Galathealinum brachiosum]